MKFEATFALTIADFLTLSVPQTSQIQSLINLQIFKIAQCQINFRLGFYDFMVLASYHEFANFSPFQPPKFNSSEYSILQSGKFVPPKSRKAKAFLS